MTFKYCKKCCTITPHKNVVTGLHRDIKPLILKECTLCHKLT